jgi:hypothetical protein
MVMLEGFERERLKLVQSIRRWGDWDLTRTCNVSTLGKHLRKVGSILASLRILNCTFKAKILTLGTMLDGIMFVPLYSTIENHYCHGLNLKETFGSMAHIDIYR